MCFTRNSCVGAAKELPALARRTKRRRDRFGMLYSNIGRAADTGAFGQAGARMRSSCRSQPAIWFQLAPVWSTKPSFPASNRPQVGENWCAYDGSNKAVSAERNSLRKKRLLEP